MPKVIDTQAQSRRAAHIAARVHIHRRVRNEELHNVEVAVIGRAVQRAPFLVVKMQALRKAPSL